MSTDNYYKDLWTAPNHHGTIFWRDVNFDTPSYKLQELRFRNMLQSLKRLNNQFVPPREICSVLEVGAGTGRMTKIVLEELGRKYNELTPNYNGIMKYDCVEINFNEERIKKTMIHDYMRMTTWYNLDITKEEFDLVFIENDPLRTYDLIVASEIFMHIKPEDIETVVKRITRLLAPNGLIINIDWFYEEEGDVAIKPWCFIHDYDKLYTENGLTPIFIGYIREIKQKMFCYGK